MYRLVTVLGDGILSDSGPNGNNHEALPSLNKSVLTPTTTSIRLAGYKDLIRTRLCPFTERTRYYQGSLDRGLLDSSDVTRISPGGHRPLLHAAVGDVKNAALLGVKGRGSGEPKEQIPVCFFVCLYQPLGN
jgi:hypothetical protein